MAYLLILLAGVSLSSIGQAREVANGISLSPIGQTRESEAVVDVGTAGKAEGISLSSIGQARGSNLG